MIRITDQYFWNVAFILFYVGLLTMAGIILNTEARMPYTDLTLFDLALISLASFRVTRLFVYDGMTKFLREQFYDAKVVRNKVTLVKPITGARRTLADLISNPWSFSMWSVTWVMFFYLLTPLAQLPVLILAFSGVVSAVYACVSLIEYRPADTLE